MHVHVQGQNGEAKFWLEPDIKLAQKFRSFLAGNKRQTQTRAGA